MFNTDKKWVAVVGSRTFTDKERLFSILTKNIAKIGIIISGGADGADAFAVEWAKKYGIPYLIFPPLWHDPETGEFNKGAGFKRNAYIVDASDVVLAFYDGISRGTANTIEMSKMKNKPLKIFKFAATEAPKEETL